MAAKQTAKAGSQRTQEVMLILFSPTIYKLGHNSMPNGHAQRRTVNGANSSLLPSFLQIKEILSQYSISQRLFGESILGLSQGSVSDLLARPKPWHMLTQKGREPFIRMKLFLEDDQAVHKLVSSQYKIAPEKLLRTGPFGGQSALAGMRKPNGHPMGMMPRMPGMPNFGERPGGLPDPAALLAGHPSLVARFGLDAATAAAAAAAAAQLNAPAQPVPSAPSPSSSSSSSLLDRPAPILDPLAVHKKLLSQKAAGGGGSTPPAPSLYEMAALTHELDTQELTRGVKEVLLTHNIGQKFFGEAVLGLSQGSVSELLSKPKLWHMLSIKGREPFIRMHLWLKDPTAVEKLQALKNERAEGGAKRKRLGGSGLDSSSDRSGSPADQADFYNTAADSPGSSGSKKPRLIFSDEQKEALKIAFTLDPYPSTSVTEFLCQELNLESRTVSNWFHNHRMRLKQQLPAGMENLPFPGREGGGGGGFEPVKFRLLCHQKMMELQQNQSEDSNGASNPPQPPLPTGGLSSFLRQFGLPVPPEAGSGGLDLTLGKGSGSGASSEDESTPTAPSAAAIVAAAAAISAGQASRSRRKPAAPQWLRPESLFKSEDSKKPEDEDEETKENSGGDDVTINGVCVMRNNSINSPKKDEVDEEEERPAEEADSMKATEPETA